MSYFDRPEAWVKHARARGSFHTYLERPAMAAMLPDIEGKSLLCLGVGSGEETEMYRELGAGSIMGIDRVPGLIEAAKLRYPEPTFEVMDMEQLKLPVSKFDVVVSSMAMHYLEDWSGLLDSVYSSLKSDGHFVFSTHNPVWWSAEKLQLPDGYLWAIGVKTNTKDRATTVIGSYLKPKKLKTEIFKNFPVEFYHRPFSHLVQDVLDSKFSLEAINEPQPIDQAKQDDPQFYRTASNISPILIFKLKRA